MAQDSVKTPNVVQSFMKGVVQGTDGNVNTAQVVGDIVGAITPGLGELKSFKDVWAGVQGRDPALMISGLIGLIPVVGDLGKLGASVAKKGTATIAKHGAQKGAAQLGKLAVRSATKAIKSPQTQKQLALAAEHAGQLALVKLVDYLGELQRKGETPQVEAQQFGDFISARDKVFGELGEKPNQSWHDLIADNGEKKEVVGRHLMGEKGFRIIAPEAGETDKDNPLRLVWWKDNVDGKTPSFGLEEVPVSRAEAERIIAAYVNRDRSFRIRS